MTRTNKLLNLLADGKNVSVKRIKKVTRLANLSSTVSRLRTQGLTIYTNKKAGETFYRLGL